MYKKEFIERNRHLQPALKKPQINNLGVPLHDVIILNQRITIKFNKLIINWNANYILAKNLSFFY